MSDALVARTSTTPRADAPADVKWSPARVAGAAVLGAWAALFWFLLVSGRRVYYLGPRTQWVVPVAAAILSAAAIGRLASGRTRHPEPIRRRELAVMAVMVAPVLLVTALPPATLGSFSADKRAGFAGSGLSTSSGDIANGELTLVDVAAGQTSPEGERALAEHAGETVDFIGFVTRYADTPPDEFLLTRYVITCCVADATSAEVRVVGVTPGAFDDNDWVEVTGTIYPLGREVIVSAAPSGVATVERPEHPYLTP
jgi:uncharacterized repeat protein (TIGR03943 family)